MKSLIKSIIASVTLIVLPTITAADVIHQSVLVQLDQGWDGVNPIPISDNGDPLILNPTTPEVGQRYFEVRVFEPNPFTEVKQFQDFTYDPNLFQLTQISHEQNFTTLDYASKFTWEWQGYPNFLSSGAHWVGPLAPFIEFSTAKFNHESWSYELSAITVPLPTAFMLFGSAFIALATNSRWKRNSIQS